LVKCKKKNGRERWDYCLQQIGKIYITKKIRKKVVGRRGIYLALTTLKPLHYKMIAEMN